jgi:hypothetical protein
LVVQAQHKGDIAPPTCHIISDDFARCLHAQQPRSIAVSRFESFFIADTAILVEEVEVKAPHTAAPLSSTGQSYSFGSEPHQLRLRLQWVVCGWSGCRMALPYTGGSQLGAKRTIQ